MPCWLCHTMHTSMRMFMYISICIVVHVNAKTIQRHEQILRQNVTAAILLFVLGHLRLAIGRGQVDALAQLFADTCVWTMNVAISTGTCMRLCMLIGLPPCRSRLHSNIHIVRTNKRCNDLGLPGVAVLAFLIEGFGLGILSAVLELQEHECMHVRYVRHVQIYVRM